jgi:hypothetical protein
MKNKQRNETNRKEMKSMTPRNLSSVLGITNSEENKLDVWSYLLVTTNLVNNVGQIRKAARDVLGS